MAMPRARWRVLGLIAAGALVALSGCKGRHGASNDVLIGEYDSLSGPTSTFGHQTHNGIELAIVEANATGGIHGKHIRLLTEDTEGKPDVARQVVTKLVTRDGVQAVLGEVASSCSLAAAPVCQQYHVPMISPSSTNPTLTQKGDYIFRTCFTDTFQGAAVAHFAHDQGYKRAAIFKDTMSDYSVVFAQIFAKEFQRLGGTIVGEQSYAAGDQDFRAQLNTLASLNPDAVLIPGYYSDVGTIARQARAMGFDVPLLGGDGWDSPLLVKAAGRTALNGCYFLNHRFSPDLKVPETQRFLAAYTARYHSDPGALGALGYDAASVLVAAMRRAKSLDGPDLRDAIAATKNFPGVTGTITIDANRNARKAAIVLEVVDGKFEYVRTYTPEEIGQ